MRQVCVMITLVFFCSFACGERSTAETEFVGTVDRAVALCVSEYVRLSGKEFFGEADNSYVYVPSDRLLLSVIFTQGQLGTFGKRSVRYGLYLSCNVDISDGLRIYALVPRRSDVVLELPEAADMPVREFHEGEGGVWELHYRRRDDRFVFDASQPFDERNYDTHNPHPPCPDYPPWLGTVAEAGSQR